MGIASLEASVLQDHGEGFFEAKALYRNARERRQPRRNHPTPTDPNRRVANLLFEIQVHGTTHKRDQTPVEYPAHNLPGDRHIF